VLASVMMIVSGKAVGISVELLYTRVLSFLLFFESGET
jgi:hypothetical protein